MTGADDTTEPCRWIPDEEMCSDAAAVALTVEPTSVTGPTTTLYVCETHRDAVEAIDYMTIVDARPLSAGNQTTT